MGRVSAAVVLVAALGGEAQAQSVELIPVATGLDGVTDIASAGDDRLFIAEQAGRIRIVEDGRVRSAPFLDLSSLVTSGGEQGLLGLAFHPDFASNGFFYVNYIDRAGDTVVARFRRSAAPNLASLASRTVILTQDQPDGFTNHKAGDLAFGPADGFLYVTLGDGGAGCDPNDFAQDGRTFLGKILRIDVDGATPYAVPPDNPFVGSSTVLPEVWALGLRNPWRIAFDRRPPHDLFIADVGQNQWEEVNVQPRGSAGGENYGWDCFEGRHPGTCSSTAACPPAGHVLPIDEYSHADGCSVTGGFVYRGRRFPALRGQYFFADLCSQQLWSLARRAGGWRRIAHGPIVPGGPRTFGEDSEGELYVATSTTVYRIEDPSAPTPDRCPTSPRACASPGRAMLLLKDAAPVGPSALDRLVFRFTEGPAEPPGAFGDPGRTTDVRLCVYAGGSSPLLEAVAHAGGTCAGPPCWEALAGGGHRFIDPALAQDGLSRVLLRPLPSEPGSRIVFAGAGIGLSLPDLPLPGGAPVVAQVHGSTIDSCWGAQFQTSDFVRNDAIAFKAILD